MCLRHLFEKIYKKTDNTNYVQLEEIRCDPIMFNTRSVFFVKKNEKIVVNKAFKTVTLAKDRIIFDDDEYIKYDYIMDFVTSRNNSIIVNTFTNINKFTNLLYADDSITSVIIHFESYDTQKFLREIMYYIKRYKRYGSWDKTVMNFEVFKLCSCR